MNRPWQFFLERCRPFELPAPWDGCPVDDACFRGPSDPSAAWAELVNTFSLSELLAGGLAAEVDGKTVLHPKLGVADVGFVLWRDESTGRIRNIVTEAGCLVGDRAPCFEVLGDRQTLQAFAAEQHEVLLVESIVDVVLLRSFGLAAAPIAGPAPLRQTDVDLLCQYYGFSRPWNAGSPEDEAVSGGACATDEAEHDRRPIGPTAMPPYSIPSSDMSNNFFDHLQLTIVDWRPHALVKTEQAGVRRMVEELNNLRLYRNLRTEAVDHWVPSNQDLDSIRFALERGERGWVRGALLTSLEDGVDDFEPPTPTAPRRAPPEFADVLRDLHAEPSSGTGDRSRQQVREALRTYREVLEREILRPLLQQAASTISPPERALRLLCAELYALFFEKAPAVRRQALEVLGHRDDAAEAGANRSMTELLKISSQLTTITRELMKWKSPSTPTRKPPAAKFSPRSGPSGWERRN